MNDADIEKWMSAMELCAYLPPNMTQFFDTASHELLDEKIEVKEALKAGTPIDQIPHFYDVLEKYPEDKQEGDTITKTLWV